MADVLTETVSPEDLKKFEKIYHEQLYKNDVTPRAQFEYAWCLVRSKYSADIQKGIMLLEELYKTNEEGHRDYLYYLAIGSARLKDYSKALNYVRSFLSIEPGNQQVLTLEEIIRKKLEKEGLVGMAFTGGIVLAVGALVGVGMAIASRGKS
ncbi:mitochondrial fission 1 protein [Diorhabda sublineata]|uniref:mitochondrial fission 1 protein n=1 Tax=Diorhabda sublineata TaxID=1163346 RepID=UPI0024E0E8F7|nr:mitochondrial fission 1 protein [Diorhabda sublineata]